MRKLGFLVVGSLLLATTAFAAGKTQTKVTIKVEGKTIATLFMDEMPQDAELVISTDAKATTVYDKTKDLTTITGKSKLEVRQGEKALLQMSIENGVVEVAQVEDEPAK